MKKISLFVLLAAMLSLMSCKEENSNNLQYVKAELGGCNISPDTRGGGSEMGSDTTIISISNGCVNVFIGFHYACKNAPFETQTEIKGNVLYMYIIDTCNDNFCYYHCLCYYTFDFVFEYQGEIYQKYKILLIDPRADEPRIISEGIISSSTLP